MAQVFREAVEASQPPPPAPAANNAALLILSLPAEVELHIFAKGLSAADLAACIATCRAWRQAAAAPELWRAHSAARWQHSSSAFAQLQREGRWLELYRERRKVRAFLHELERRFQLSAMIAAPTLANR